MKSVSIIISAYNAERTIAECQHAAINLRWPGTVEIVGVNTEVWIGQRISRRLLQECGLSQ